METKNSPYNSEFYNTYSAESSRSATAVLSIADEILHHPKHIVDVGCGIGTWLRAWKQLGATSVVGIDGHLANDTSLLIDPREYLSMDLTRPHPIDGLPFDLAQTLEVAEHLPEDVASQFVTFLCSLSPVVLFSAAIPHQGGTSHVNEQWPEYWADLFHQNDYSVFDVIRPRVWDSTEVAYYYAQNTLMFASRARPEICNLLEQARDSSKAQPLARVHPRKWEEKQVVIVPQLERLLPMLPESAFLFGKRAVRRAQRSIGAWLPATMKQRPTISSSTTLL